MAKSAKSASAAERAYALILHKRSRKKIPDFESMEELSLVPYLDVMMNLVIFMLVTIASFLPMGILTIYPPAIKTDDAVAAQTPPPSIQFTVAISLDTGFYVSTADNPPAPIAKTANGDFNYEELAKKAVELKDKHKEERTVTIVADRAVRYEVLIKTMDALRFKDGKNLFDDVKFGEAR
jgi:biopolymer transport protein TolR